MRVPAPRRTRLSATRCAVSLDPGPVRDRDDHRLGHRAAREVVQQAQRRLVGVLEVVDDQQQAVSGGCEAHQLRDRDEQALVAGLAGPADVPARQGTLDLEAEPVVETVEQCGVLAAQLTERLEDGRVGPRALDGGGGAATGAPVALAGQCLGEPEHRGLADAGQAGDQQGGAAPLVGPGHGLADLVADAPTADQSHTLAAACCGATGLRVQPGAEPLCLRARGGAELAEQGVVEALELPQRRAYVAPVGVAADQGEVGRLVGRVLLEHVVPAARPGAAGRRAASGRSRAPPRPTARRGRRAAVARRTSPARPAGRVRRTRLERLSCPARGTRRRRCGRRRRAGARPCRCAAAPPTRRRRGRDGRSGRPCAAAGRPPRRWLRATAPR